MNKPLVSIIINNYNYAKYLGRSIDSALNQTYSNIEVIVVDDGSTDSSADVLKNYGDRIKALIKENGGQASAINEGYQASRGEILIFLDADDELLPDAVTEVITIFTANPRIVKVQYRLKLIDTNGKALGGSLPPRHWVLPNGDITRMLRKNRVYAHPPTSGNAFRKDVIEKLMPIPDKVFTRAPLSHLIYLVGLYGEIGSIDTLLGNYRLHGDNFTKANRTTYDPEKLKEYLNIGTFIRNEQARIFKETRGIKIGKIAPGDFTHIKQRVTLKKLDPELYPYNDHLLGLCFLGIVSAIISPIIRFRDRPVWILWFLCIYFSSKSFSRRLIEQELESNKRFPILKFILRKRARLHGG
jgi:glycosyltransferase involved in cell wall biosynthesis